MIKKVLQVGGLILVINKKYALTLHTQQSDFMEQLWVSFLE